ncbi:MAG: carbohydrate-binding family 9-like protein, partial [Eubacteriales bacterium]|nr:carbohydrate-binding family 9-like protein [Eubacteriales bacterium]
EKLMLYEIKKKVTNEYDEIDWSAVNVADINQVAWGYDQPDVEPHAQLCYDKDYLYVRLYTKEKEIRAMEVGLHGMPCRDSCLEFFFAPMGDDRYFNIEFNPNCAMFLGFGTCPDTLFRLEKEIEPEKVMNPVAKRTKEGWEITYSVPFTMVKTFFPEFKPVSGTKMRANLYKCGDLTVKEHYFSWSPMPEKMTFHNPAAFGDMIFE